MEFTRAGSDKWHSHAEIVFQDGEVMSADATPPLDGTPTPMTGNDDANVTTVRMPAPNTLVMQRVDHGTPTSTRISTVASDRTTMTATKAYLSHDGQPLLPYKCIPEPVIALAERWRRCTRHHWGACGPPRRNRLAAITEQTSTLRRSRGVRRARGRVRHRRLAW
ncbi:hypothetical protein [Xanthomonas maliensis]|uniref:hypothetical protein n=1 Tax=Xanthomonas maliensis TaxID=1321368 RepID=UPI00039EE27F|nr:hypothetical protein [Xanthomonas maliensis]